MTGWRHLPPADFSGQSWTLDFAAKVLDIPERDLRDIVRITALQPCGVMNMRTFSTSGRTPRAYAATELIRITEAVLMLRESQDQG